MKLKFSASIGAALVAISSIVFAGPQEEFCAGFSEGFKTVKGDMAMVPMCPLAPMTPMGSTPFREGIKAGIVAARRG